jgi:carboxymethylenebutenolidase
MPDSKIVRTQPPMTMQERHDFVTTPDGRMEVFVVHPATSGSYPAVVMYQNVGGFSELLRDMARRLAAEGYYCVVPDLYYRLGRIVIDPDSHDADILAIRKIASGSLKYAMVMNDTQALLSFLDGDPVVRRGPMGTIGYCQGGRFCVWAAEKFPGRFTATTSLFGTQLMADNPNSPHLTLDRIRGEIYFGFAEHDHMMPLDQVERFKQLLERDCKAEWIVEVHPGTEHGYAFPGRAVYHRDASERSWERAFAMYKRQL